MNQQTFTMQTTVGPERRNETHTLLHGRWLLFARIAWGGLVVFSLAIFLVSLPVYFAHYQTICTGAAAACDSSQLSPESAKTLPGFGLSVTAYATLSLLLAVVNAWVWFVVALVIVLRKSSDWMGLLVGLMLVMQGTNITAGSLQFGQPNWLFLSLLENYLSFVLLFLVFSLFPDGRFVPRWTRWLVIGWSIASVPTLIPHLTFFPLLFYLLLWFGSLLCLGGAQIYRYSRASNGVERQQTKWVVFSVIIVILVEIGLVFPLLFFPQLAQNGSLYAMFSSTLGNIIPVLIPLSIGMAMLRYRLWEIDILINRTLVYGTLTGILALVYVGSIIVFQSLLRGLFNQTSEVAIVISTLLIAALFQPLRKLFQVRIDRRFYRHKYDAERTVAAFSATLRNEVDLDQLHEDVIAVVEETMQPEHISLWIRLPDPSRQPNTRLLPRIEEGERE